MRKHKGVLLILILVFLLLWFSDILPLKVAEFMAVSYLSNKGDYQLLGSDYSPAHDCYFVYFNDGQEDRNIGIYHRFFPFDVYFDSKYPG